MTISLKVINLWHGPGAGGSTTAAGLFNIMKVRGHKVELVTEVAKDLTWEHSWKTMENQLLLLGLQDQRLRRLDGQVEWAITDSPLPLGIAYMTKEYQPWLELAVWDAYDRYQNFDVLLDRTCQYRRDGRSQTHQEALGLDLVVGELWRDAWDEDADHAVRIEGGFAAPHQIYEWIFKDHG